MFDMWFPRHWSTLKKLIWLKASALGEAWRTVTGAIVSFVTSKASALRSLVVTLDPIQSGSGDPAPDNIRPISGWTEAKVWVKPTHDTSSSPTVTIDLGGTRYGGTLNVLTGVLTVDRAYVIYNGTEDWHRVSTTTKSFFVQTNTLVKSTNYRNSVVCNRLKTVPTNGSVNSIPFTISGYSDTNNTYPGQNWIYCKADGDTIATVGDFKAWLASNNLQVVYELATPLTVQLTAQQVSSLAGTNHIWSDAGDVTVEYKA